jgi:hypothetical protein
MYYNISFWHPYLQSKRREFTNNNQWLFTAPVIGAGKSDKLWFAALLVDLTSG